MYDFIYAAEIALRNINKLSLPLNGAINFAQFSMSKF